MFDFTIFHNQNVQQLKGLVLEKKTCNANKTLKSIFSTNEAFLYT